MVNNTKGLVKNEWIDRIESYVTVNNARTLVSLNEDGILGKGSWEIFTGKTEEFRQDIKVADGCLLSLVEVDNLTIDGNPDIKKGLRVYIHYVDGNKLEETLYLAVDDDGVIGQGDVCYEWNVADAYRIIKDFRSNPSKYVVDIDEMGMGWGTIVDTISDEIYETFIKTYRDGVFLAADVLKSGMYSDRIKEIAEEFGIYPMI